LIISLLNISDRLLAKKIPYLFKGIFFGKYISNLKLFIKMRIISVVGIAMSRMLKCDTEQSLTKSLQPVLMIPLRLQKIPYPSQDTIDLINIPCVTR